MNSSVASKTESSVRSIARFVGTAAALVMFAAGSAHGQAKGAAQPMATRAELTAQAGRLERGSAADRTQAASIRARLREGDFRPGERLALVIEGNVTLVDSAVAVTAGPKVSLPDIGDIPLAGVLRSELQEHMKTQLARYVRDARVRATPLVRLSVLGPVSRPGFYFMPADIPISDAVMRAGGPAGDADLGRSVIRRGSGQLYDRKRTQWAINDGLTLDQLSLRSGDELRVGTRSGRNWQSVASIVSVVTSLVFAISYGLSR
jgi:protein involved in polysaccharide export with SLBB domain